MAAAAGELRKRHRWQRRGFLLTTTVFTAAAGAVYGNAQPIFVCFLVVVVFMLALSLFA